MYKLLYSFLIILLGLVTGYILQYVLIHQKKTGNLNNTFSKENIIRVIQKIALLFLNPIALISALWQVKLDNFGLILLPLLGIIAIFTGGSLSWLYASKMKYSNAQIGTLIISGGFTNIGNIGGVITFIFLGETGYALVPLYKLFEELIYYGIGFPIARAHSDEVYQKGSLLRKLFSDIFIVVAVSSVIVGLILNYSHLPRPSYFKTLNQVIIPISTYLLLITIGLNIKLTKISKYLKPALMLMFIKSICTPIIVTTICYFLGLGSYSDGLVLKVVLILSSMPSGFLSLVPPTLYRLDVDLANAVWMTTTLSLLWIIPLLSYLMY
ncbi:hypothetical protein QE109_07995 [Fusibacter bizertensis]|uniref:Transporter n=1 Tax=Fusibacter bizertensis TaxID=1488331 RepID=A0ABT6NCJ0_9FIRM|nr:hypothetical protein [Fusibacter bizertensis]MDH8678085.1 hypothetical protein [Fusibacter bizertensis]